MLLPAPSDGPFFYLALVSLGFLEDSCWEVGGIFPSFELSFPDYFPHFLFFLATSEVEGWGGIEIGGRGKLALRGISPSMGSK